MSESTAITKADEPVALTNWTPRFEMSVQEAVTLVKQREEFLTAVLRPGIDYGVIPGTGTKPTMYKPGAERTLAAMGLHAELKDDAPPIIDFIGTEEHGKEPLIFYQRKCEVYRQVGPEPHQKMLVGSASGSCSSREVKYRYRNGERLCPTCSKATIIKGKKEYGGGWVCFAKKGGCGAKFDDGDKAIEGQTVGRVLNPDIADVANTILKMADKRALVAAAIMATGYSDYLTQDLEDHADEPDADDGFQAAPPAAQKAKAAPARKAQAPAPVVHEGTATEVPAAAPAPAQAQPAPVAQAAPADAPAPPRNTVGSEISALIKTGVEAGTLNRTDFSKMLVDAKINSEELKQYGTAWYHYAEQANADILLHLLKTVVTPEESAPAELPMA